MLHLRVWLVPSARKPKHDFNMVSGFLLTSNFNMLFSCFEILQGFNAKDNNSNGSENDSDKKMSKLFTYEEPESSVRHRRSCLQFEDISF